MADAAVAQRAPQGRGDVVLADHLGEGLRAVSTVQSGGHPHRLVEAADVHRPERWTSRPWGGIGDIPSPGRRGPQPPANGSRRDGQLEGSRG
ncbi:hypothetical protein GCM10028787_06520 [Brachybacterium horti]